MEFRDFEAAFDDSGKRLDRILKALLAKDQQSKIDQVLRKNLIKVNGKKAKGSDRIQEKDIITIAAFLLENSSTSPLEKSEENQKSKVPKDLPKIEVVFKNEYLKIINKPYNVLCQSAKGSTFDLSTWAKEEFKKEKKEDSLSFKTGALHRLDLYTTGLLVFSQNAKGASWFSSAIKEGLVRKTYLGIAEGNLQKEILWKDLLVKEDLPQFNFYKVKDAVFFKDSEVEKNNFPKVEKARTIARPLAHGHYQGKDITLVEYKILTGKKHQIRFQSAKHSMPLLGDSAYGSKIKMQVQYFLHAFCLTFPKDNPLNVPEKITVFPPDFFQKAINDFFSDFSLCDFFKGASKNCNF